MQLVSFQHGGQARYGVLQGQQVATPNAAFTARYPDLLSVFDAQALPALAAAVADSPLVLDLASVTLLPTLPQPRKIFCIGLNYKTHVAEAPGRRAPVDLRALCRHAGGRRATAADAGRAVQPL